MLWRSLRELYNPGEAVDLVYDRLEGKKVRPVAYANTELYSKCNIAIRLENGHIVVDDCEERALDGMTFRNEAYWRRDVGLDEDDEMIHDLFG